jgi:hypothetical protein
MTEKEVKCFNKSFYLLYGYYILLLFLSSILYVDLVSVMIKIFFLYGVVLFFFLIWYVIFISYKLYMMLHNKQKFQWVNIIITLKMIIAIMPMFFFDNRLADIIFILNKKIHSIFS